MATHKATLGKTVDGVVEYIYPKSTSDIIEYTETQSVKEKLDELDEKQGVAYGTCSTAASTAAKVVSCDGFVLETGATIVVSFDNANSASSPTMNVNSTGAKSIYAYGTTAPSTNSWRAGGMMAFTYDGTGWVMQDFSTANTSYYGVTKLSDSVSSTSTTLAGTANAVKTAYDAATAAQDAADAAQTAADAAMSYAEANTYTHPTVTASNTTSTATATYGGTFTAVDSVTRDSCGHVTGVNTKTITMPAENTTADKLGTATVGSGTNPIYLSSGTATASTSTVGSGTKPVYLSSGTITASSSSVGSATTPVYLSSGTITACSGITASTADSATTAETAEKLGSATVGSGTKPIYLSSGTATASSSTVGSGVIPMYLSSGTMTASTSTVGSGTKPIYLSSGTLTVSSSTVGSGTIPMYLSSGTLTASTSTVGSGTKPMYLSSGTLTASSSTVGSSSAPVYLSSGTITACTGVATSSDLSSLSDTVSELSDEIDDLKNNSGSPEVIISLAGCNGFYMEGDLGTVTADNVDDFCDSYGLGSDTRKDVYIGCYFTASINGSDRVLRIASFDHDLNNYSAYGSQGKRHTVIVPDTYLYSSCTMNSSSTTEGAYVGSRMYTETIPIIDGYLQDVFGSHLVQFRNYLPNSVDTSMTNYNRPSFTGVVNGNTSCYYYSILMSEIEVYGKRYYSCDNGWYTCGYSIEHQLPLFWHNHKLIVIPSSATVNGSTFTPSTSTTYYWLRDVASSSSFCNVSNYGCPLYYGASGSRYVRPWFALM